jgi:hypothetical protein
MRNHKLVNRAINFIESNVNNYYIDDLYNIINTNEFNNTNINNVIIEIIDMLNNALINSNNNLNLDKERLRRHLFDLISYPNGIDCCLKIINHYMT